MIRLVQQLILLGINVMVVLLFVLLMRQDFME